MNPSIQPALPIDEVPVLSQMVSALTASLRHAQLDVELAQTAFKQAEAHLWACQRVQAKLEARLEAVNLLMDGR